MNKMFSGLAAFTLQLALGACSSDDSSSGGLRAEAIAECKKFCAKQLDCNPGVTINCDTLCSQSAPSNGSTNCDITALKAKVNECVAGTCEGLEACADDLDAICPGEEPGTGGSGNGSGGGVNGSGGGGNGTGGGGQGTDCSVCDDALTCCQALVVETGGEAADCEGLSASECTASGQESLFVQSCTAVIQSGAGLGIAACQ